MIDYGPFDPPTTDFVDRLQFWAREQAQQPAFLFLPEGEDEQLQVSYSQLHARAAALADRLLRRGAAGERALLLYPPGLDFVCGLLGCLYAGVTAVPAYPPRRNRNMLRIQAIADDAQARLALTVAEVAERADSFYPEAPHLADLDWLSTDAVADDGAERAAGDFTPPPVDVERPAVLQYTSGSTGAPKGVVLSHANLMHNAALIGAAFHLERETVGVTWLPMYHDMGLIGGLFMPLLCGRPNVLMPPLSFLSNPVRWLQAISQHRGNVSGGPNFAYQLCVDRIAEADCRGLDLSCWHVAFNGAEPVRADTLAAFAEKFAPYGFRREALYPCYGLAETTLMAAGGRRLTPTRVAELDGRSLDDRRVVAAAPDGPAARELVGCGRGLSGMEIVIADPSNRRRLPPGEVGEIWVRGPSVAVGYWNQPQITAELFRARLSGDGATAESYLRTGDLGFWDGADADAELFITGRLKDLIIVRGRNFYPHDLERTVEQADERLIAGGTAAFAVELERAERLVLVCEVQRRRSQPWDEVITAVRRRVAEEHEVTPDAVLLVRLASVPKTSSGKIQRHACREAFLDDALKVVAQWRAWTDPAAVRDWSSWQDAYDGGMSALGIDPATARGVFDAVRHVARERAGDLSLDTNIFDLGLDSLERMEVVALLEKQFGGRLPGQTIAETQTCREVVLAVQSHLSNGRPYARGAAAEAELAAAGDLRGLPEMEQLQAQFSKLAELGLDNPYFAVHQGVTGDRTVIDGREFINFCSYNYLGMSGDPVVTAAAKAAIDRFGTSASASRLVSGERPVHGELEAELAQLLGVEDAVAMVGGHATNESTIGHLMRPGDLIVHDELAHNSIVQGALLSGARRRSFPHNDAPALDELLSKLRCEYRRVLIAVEGVYSMDGDLPDLPRIIDVKRKHHALLLVDEAHSLGTLGETGRGAGEHFGVDPSEVDLWMGTLSKSLGSCGGYIAGSRDIVQYLKYTAPGFVYSVGMSPANAAAALSSLHQLIAHPNRVAQLQRNGRRFAALAGQHGLNTGAAGEAPIIPVIVGDSVLAMRASRRLFDRGVNVQPIVHPAVEEQAARLRFFVTAMHTEAQIRFAVETTAEFLAAAAADAPPAPPQDQPTAGVESAER